MRQPGLPRGELTIELYEILVPTISNGGRPFRLKHHRVWDSRVRSIAGGLTVLSPVKGQWVCDAGNLFSERMIPVRIACSRGQIEQIADFTARHYRQLAVLFWKVSDEVVVRHYPEMAVAS